MPVLVYFFVFLASFLVDVIPFVGPPAWTVMVFFQIMFQLNMWIVLLFGVTGSAIGRYYYSVYIRWLSRRYVKEEKNDDLHFLGSRLSDKGWTVQLFVFIYTLIPVPTTPLFTAAGVAHIRSLHIMPAFFISENLSATIAGLFIISVFLFINWQKLLLEKKPQISFTFGNEA